jgi:integration host factor subunit beta
VERRRGSAAPERKAAAGESGEMGKAMTKSDLVARVSERTPGISMKDSETIVNLIFDSMTEALMRGDKIEIRGFGSFKVKHRDAREGRNPRTGEEVKIPAKRTPFFKVGKELKDRIDS